MDKAAHTAACTSEGMVGMRSMMKAVNIPPRPNQIIGKEGKKSSSPSKRTPIISQYHQIMFVTDSFQDINS